MDAGVDFLQVEERLLEGCGDVDEGVGGVGGGGGTGAGVGGVDGGDEVVGVGVGAEGGGGEFFDGDVG